MRAGARLSIFLLLAALIGLIANVRPVTASGDRLRIGDTLLYEATLELQQQRVQGGKKPSEQTSDASGTAVEKFSIYNIGADGTAYAVVNTQFHGTQDSQPISLHGTFQGKILPDGQIRLQGGIAPGIDEALNFANAVMRDVTRRPRLDATPWKISEKTTSVELLVTRRMAGRKVYQKLPVLVFESLANGVLRRTSDGKDASGSVSLTGTAYYDNRDHLFVGESIRSLIALKTSTKSSDHVNYLTSINVVLDSLAHAQQVPNEQTETEATLSPEPESPSPADVSSSPPTSTPLPQATITPRSGY